MLSEHYPEEKELLLSPDHSDQPLHWTRLRDMQAQERQQLEILSAALKNSEEIETHAPKQEKDPYRDQYQEQERKEVEVTPKRAPESKLVHPEAEVVEQEEPLITTHFMGNSKPIQPWPRKPSRPQKRAVDRTVKPWLTSDGSRDPKTTRPKFSFQKRKSIQELIRPNGKTKYELAREKAQQRSQMKAQGVFANAAKAKAKGKTFAAMKQWQEKQKKCDEERLARQKANWRRQKQLSYALKKQAPVQAAFVEDCATTKPQEVAIEAIAKSALASFREEVIPQVVPDRKQIAAMTDPSTWQHPIEQDDMHNDTKRSEPPSADSDNGEQPQHEKLPDEPLMSYRRKRTLQYPKYSHHVSQVFGSNMKANTARVRVKNFQKRNKELCQTPKLSASELKRRVEELDAREAEMKNERRELQRLRQSAKESLKRARQKEMEITKLQEEVTSKFDNYKKKEMKLLDKQRGEVQRKLRQLSLVPVKEERDRSAALERMLQEERERHEREEARLKASVGSVRKSNAQLQARIKQQKEEISRLRQARLEAWGSAGNVDAVPMTKGRGGLYHAKATKMLYSNSYINSSRTKRKLGRGSGKSNCRIISSHSPAVRSSHSPAVRSSHSPAVRSSHSPAVRKLPLKEPSPINSTARAIKELGTFEVVDDLPEPKVIHVNHSEHYKPTSTSQPQVNGFSQTVPTVEPTPLQSIPTFEKLKVQSWTQAAGLPPIPEIYRVDMLPADLASCQAATGSTAPANEIEPQPGKRVLDYWDHSRRVEFANNSFQIITPPNSTVRTCQCYANGDIEKELQDGTIVYFYKENQIITATEPNGVERLYFQSQFEVKFPSGEKDIIFPDGRVQRFPADVGG